MPIAELTGRRDYAGEIRIATKTDGDRRAQSLRSVLEEQRCAEHVALPASRFCFDQERGQEENNRSKETLMHGMEQSKITIGDCMWLAMGIIIAIEVFCIIGYGIEFIEQLWRTL
jgi:hypothetical protein